MDATRNPNDAVTRKNSRDQLEKLAQETKPGLVSEFREFLRENKKWWLAPILGALLILSVLIVFGGSSLMPFIYTLF